jgi:ribonuclease I
MENTINTEPIGVPGDFDYYVLQMSYAPEFCNTHPADKNTPECSGNYNLVLHGLWPEYNKPRIINGKSYQYPQFCSKQWDNSDIQSILNEVKDWDKIAPEYQTLLQHELSKHCSCTTLDPITYAKLAVKLALDLPNPKIDESMNKAQLQLLLPNGQLLYDTENIFSGVNFFYDKNGVQITNPHILD